MKQTKEKTKQDKENATEPHFREAARRETRFLFCSHSSDCDMENRLWEMEPIKTSLSDKTKGISIIKIMKKLENLLTNLLK